jgi:uncharacterized protein YcfL
MKTLQIKLLFSLCVFALLMVGCNSNPADSEEHKAMVETHDQME